MVGYVVANPPYKLVIMTSKAVIQFQKILTLGSGTLNCDQA